VHLLQLLLADRRLAVVRGGQEELDIRQQRVRPPEVPAKTLLHVQVPVADLEAKAGR
jgi:hypothetical protein